MNKMKIFNDPVYGFINFPYEILYDIIDHPNFQRLRRISQLGLSHFVYPGALHTRFHHAIGATHLMCTAIDVLRSKGAEISTEEAEAASIAILMHDIGHGPFSHALEGRIIHISHEEMSVHIMEQMDIEFKGKLALAIRIFQNNYPKVFLNQLVSSQLDMDRMDYLNRDSFFTGVAEGVIGYDRIIKMLAVHQNEIVVEEKGIHSIEKFLMARRIMYWQVYLHKTVLSAEQMLIRLLTQLKTIDADQIKGISPALSYFFTTSDRSKFSSMDVKMFNLLDDFDIFQCLKRFQDHPNIAIRTLSRGLIHRKIFKIELAQLPFEDSYKHSILERMKLDTGLSMGEVKLMFLEGSESNQSYNHQKNEIRILFKSGEIVPISEVSDNFIDTKTINKHFICYPKKYAIQT